MAEKIETGSERESGEEKGSSGRRSSRSSSGSGDKLFQYHGWVYHLGTNSIGHEFCHLRFLLLKGKYAFMYKRDPFENPSHKPIRKGVIGPSLMVEELGRKGAMYVLKFYNRLDETKKGESEAIRKLPFVLVLNLQVPAKPNYSLVLYYGSERPIRQGSLLSKFVDGTDAFQNSRFKLIPSIVEGYWMVKRAVGTKACLLGRAVTCKYLRRQNFLEIDVDIGSSSVARSIISLVLGYVTSLVIDLAVLIEAKEENELPEHILGTVRLNKIKVESAVSF